MPKQLKDIKEFLKLASLPSVKKITVHTYDPAITSNTSIGRTSRDKLFKAKFKLKLSKYMYTVVIDVKEKAIKLENSLPRNLLSVISKKNKKKSIK